MSNQTSYYRTINAVTINTRCIEIMRQMYGRDLKIEEYDICHQMGKELADLFPPDYEIPAIHQVTTDQILRWIETKWPEPYMGDESARNHRLQPSIKQGFLPGLYHRFRAWWGLTHA